MQATVAEREDERRLHEELDRAFNEMRAQLNAQLRPELSELATTFLRELMDSRTAEIELDEKYNITVLEDGIAKPVLSGGEEDLANLVLRLAVSQMIAERSGQAFSLLDSRRGIRVARRDAAVQRARAAARARRPFRAGDSHHAHRSGARRTRSGDFGPLRSVARGIGRGADVRAAELRTRAMRR